MNRFDSLMFYAFILSMINYAMDDVSRMKEVKTQKTTTRNLAQFIFNPSLPLIHVFHQWSKFTILHYYLFHYALPDLVPYTPSHPHNTSCISPHMENHSFQVPWMKCAIQHSLQSSLSPSSLPLCHSSFPILYRLLNALYAWFPLFNPNRSPIVLIMLYSSGDGGCIVSGVWQRQYWLSLIVSLRWILKELKWPYSNQSA